MGFQLKDKKGPIADINVTPLVDVMLVLLVIFMISAPLMFSGVTLKLPKTKKVSNIKLTKKQVILSITQNGDFYIGDDKFLEEELIDVVANKMKSAGTETLFVRADYALPYGNVAMLISKLKHKGVSNISLVTQIDNKAK